MAGGAKYPAGEAQGDAFRLPAPVGDMSKPQVVNILLFVQLALVAAGVAIGLFWVPEVDNAFGLGEAWMGLLFCGVTFLLLLVNRLGYWGVATWGLVACLVLSSCIFVDLHSFDRVFILLAVPVVAAAFLLRPATAFEVAGLATACYTLVWLRQGPVPGFNFLSVLALTGIALVSWLLARRVEWLEEADDMARRELDRMVDERDVLKGQVRAMADELDRLRRQAESREGRTLTEHTRAG